MIQNNSIYYINHSWRIDQLIKTKYKYMPIIYYSNNKLPIIKSQVFFYGSYRYNWLANIILHIVGFYHIYIKYNNDMVLDYYINKSISIVKEAK